MATVLAIASAVVLSIPYDDEYIGDKKFEELIDKVQGKVFQGLNIPCHKLPDLIVFKSFTADDLRVGIFGNNGNNAPISGTIKKILTSKFGVQKLFFPKFMCHQQLCLRLT